MVILKNETKDQVLLTNLIVATSFASRAKGLIGTKALSFDEGIHFPKTNWIHTCFMSMPIDVVYLSRSMTITKLQPNLQPWKFPAPVFGARSVIELKAGFIEKHNLEIGDQLNVGH